MALINQIIKQKSILILIHEYGAINLVYASRLICIKRLVYTNNIIKYFYQKYFK